MPPDSPEETGSPAATDLEAGNVIASTRLGDWTQAASVLDIGLIERLFGDTQLLSALQQTSLKQAQEYVRAANPPLEGEWTVTRMFRESTAWTNMKGATQFRRMLQQLPLNPTAQDSDRPLLIIDLARDTLATLKQQIEALRPQDLAVEDRRDLPFMKHKATRAVDELIQSIGATAYDTPLAKRVQIWETAAAIVGVQILPFLYAGLSNPIQFYLLGNLARGAVQAETELAGLVLDPAPHQGMMWEHFRERQLGAIVGAVLFGVGTFAAHLGLQKSAVDWLQNGINSRTWLAIAAVVASLIYVTVNHAQVAPMAARTIGRKLRLAPGRARRFHDGKMRIPPPSLETPNTPDTPDEHGLGRTIAGIQHTTRLATSLVKTLKATVDIWEGKEQPGHFRKIGKAQRRHAKETEEKLQNLLWTIERVVGGVEGALNLPLDERRKKRVTGTVLAFASTALAAISVIAAKKSPALLASSLPYYLSAVAIQAIQTIDPKTPLEEVIRSFGAYNGGTSLNLPASVTNTIFELFKNEGAFDLVNDNQAELARHPNRILTEHPELHPLHGVVNFALYMTYSVVTNALVGDKPGRWLAGVVSKVFGARVPAADPEQPAQQVTDRITAWIREVQDSRSRQGVAPPAAGESRAARGRLHVDIPPNPSRQSSTLVPLLGQGPSGRVPSPFDRVASPSPIDSPATEMSLMGEAGGPPSPSELAPARPRRPTSERRMSNDSMNPSFPPTRATSPVSPALPDTSASMQPAAPLHRPPLAAPPGSISPIPEGRELPTTPAPAPHLALPPTPPVAPHLSLLSDPACPHPTPHAMPYEPRPMQPPTRPDDDDRGPLQASTLIHADPSELPRHPPQRPQQRRGSAASDTAAPTPNPTAGVRPITPPGRTAPSL